jgi:hypothetical protein
MYFNHIYTQHRNRVKTIIILKNKNKKDCLYHSRVGWIHAHARSYDLPGWIGGLFALWLVKGPSCVQLEVGNFEREREREGESEREKEREGGERERLVWSVTSVAFHSLLHNVHISDITFFFFFTLSNALKIINFFLTIFHVSVRQSHKTTTPISNVYILQQILLEPK